MIGIELALVLENLEDLEEEWGIFDRSALDGLTLATGRVVGLSVLLDAQGILAALAGVLGVWVGQEHPVVEILIEDFFEAVRKFRSRSIQITDLGRH